MPRSWLSEVAAMLQSLAKRFIGSILGGVPVVLAAFGCQREEVPVVPPEPVQAVEIAVAPVAEPKQVPEDAGVPIDSGPRQLGFFSITFYYVIGEEEVPAKAPVAANDNELVDIAAQEVTTLYDADCKEIAQVAPEFASQ